MSALLDAIYENLKQIELNFSPTAPSFSKDKKQTADSREMSVAEFLESFFPRTYSVAKGPIYSSKEVSSEIDCVILAPNHRKRSINHIFTTDLSYVILCLT